MPVVRARADSPLVPSGPEAGRRFRMLFGGPAPGPPVRARLAVLAGLTASAVALAGCGSSAPPAPAEPPPVTSPEAAAPTTSATPDPTPAPPQTAAPLVSPTPASPAAAPEPTAVPTPEPSAASPSPAQEAVPSAPDPAEEDAYSGSTDPPSTDRKRAEESWWFLDCPVHAEADVYASQQVDQSPASTQTDPPVVSATPDSPQAAAPEPAAASPVSIPKAGTAEDETEQAAVNSFARGLGGTAEDDSTSDDWKSTAPDSSQSDPSTEEPSGVRGSVDGEARTEGEVYTWRDGDRTRRVLLQSDLAVGAEDKVVRGSGGGDPVFVSESSGELMTLPGGVLLVFVPDWSRDQIDTFFSEQGIKQSRVTEQTFTTNAFFVETEPGFPSLDLANALAREEGVLLASPNWQREVSLR